jgi:hypothetical protein
MGGRTFREVLNRSYQSEQSLTLNGAARATGSEDPSIIDEQQGNRSLRSLAHRHEVSLCVQRSEWAHENSLTCPARKT